MLKNTRNMGNCNYIFVENATRFKNHEYDDWYREYITGDSGIWVGNGIDDQYLISINSNRRTIVNNCGSSYGYVIKQGNYRMIKLLGIKEEKDDEF